MELTAALYLVRHGQSEWNLTGRLQGQAMAVGLTELGREQARAAAEELVDKGIRAIYSSDQRRAVQTAEVIAERLGRPVTTVAGLRERSYGTFEGMPTSDVLAATTGVDWIDPDSAVGGGESARDVYERMAATLTALRATATGPVLAVSHGDAIRVAHAWLSGRPVDDLGWLDVPNGAVLRYTDP